MDFLWTLFSKLIFPIFRLFAFGRYVSRTLVSKMQSVAALPARPSSVKITIKEIQRMERGKWLVELTSTHRTSRVERQCFLEQVLN